MNAPGVRRCRRCPQPAKDDSDFCPACHDKQKLYQRKAMEKKRRGWEKKKLCTRCGRKRKPRHPWGCMRCLMLLGRLRRREGDVKQKRDRVAARIRLETRADGRTRRRYHGKHRGRASGAEMDEETLREIREATQRCADGLAIARAPEHAELPAIQRAEAIKAALSYLHLAGRFITEMLERHRYPMEPKSSE